METQKLIILGKSLATISMILDNLESTNKFYEIQVAENISKTDSNESFNQKFQIQFDANIDKFSKVFLGVYKCKTKKIVYEYFNLPQNRFINVINTNISISSTSKIGVGCLINPFVTIAAHTEIGNFVSINRNCSIGHHTKIDDFVTINPGSNIAGHVNIGQNTMIGMGCNIFDSITIGKNTIISAGTLVSNNIPDNVIAYGSPCRYIQIK